MEFLILEYQATKVRILSHKLKKAHITAPLRQVEPK